MKKNNLSRMARIAQVLEQKRLWLSEAGRQAEMLQRAGLVVSGEIWMLNELRIRVEACTEKLEKLVNLTNMATGATLLKQLEELLSEAEWELTDSLMQDLKKKEDSWREVLNNRADEVAGWRARITDLKQKLDKAKEARAPIITEEREVRSLVDLVERAVSELKEERLDDLNKSLRQLSSESEKIQQLIEKISAKIEQIRPFASQADLLVLQSPLVEQRFPYTVLLRTPSEPGSHGINIQASSTLSRQDRKWMNEKIEQITLAVNNGLARQFEIKRGTKATTGTVPTIPVQTSEIKVTPKDNTRHGRVGTSISETASVDVNLLAKDVGNLMYRLFMPEQMQEYLHETPCSLTITTNDLELPWELMWHQGEHLCLNRPIARMPMGYSFPARRNQLVREGSKLRFLLIYSDPRGNLPAARREVEQIQAGLERDWKDQIDIRVIDREQASGHELNTLLWTGAYDVIHYAGHAHFDENDHELSGLILKDEEIFFAQKIRRILEGKPLVFLNACESGRTANEENAQEVKQYLQKPAEGLAASFIYGGAIGCIGSLWPVYDEPAAQFAIQLYNKVLEGYMIGEAMRLVRRKIREDFKNQITWASFVLYGDPTFRLRIS